MYQEKLYDRQEILNLQSSINDLVKQGILDEQERVLHLVAKNSSFRPKSSRGAESTVDFFDTSIRDHEKT